MIREISTLIETLTGFAIGTTLQVGHRVQDAPDRCILVGESGGGSPNYYMAFVGMADVNIQVLARGMSYFEARDDCWAVYNALSGTSNWNMPAVGSGPDYLAMVVEAISTPAYIGQDENGRYEFSVNFIFRVEEGSCEE